MAKRNRIITAKTSTVSAMDAAPDELVNILERRFEVYRNARAEIEDEWSQDYDAFMHRYKKELKTGEGVDWRSQAYHPMTRIKVNIAVSQMSDVWFRGGKFPYAIENTPIPDSPVNEEMEMLGFDMEERIKAMGKRIDDELIEGRTNDELLACGQACALYGTGVIRGPFTEMRERYRYVGKIPDEVRNQVPPLPQSQDPEQAKAEAEKIMEQQRQIFKESVRFEQTSFKEPVPIFRNFDIWDFFADPESTGDTQTMTGMFGRQYLTNAELAGLKDIVDQDGKPLYDATAIDEILRENSDDTQDGSVGPHRLEQNVSEPQRVIEVLEYCGILTKKDIASKIKIADSKIADIDPVEVIVVICRHKVLRAVENTAPGKMRPYHMVQWERIPGTPYGRGLGRNLRDPQSVLNGFVRAYIDNKNLSANSMVAIRSGALDPSEDANPVPGKILHMRPEVRDIREVIQPVVYPDVTQGLLDAMQRAEEWGDTASSIPKVMEGQSIRGPQETAFEINQRITSAAKQLGLVLKYFDERVICPMIRALYHWNMAVIDDPKIKGDFDIKATGFGSYQDRTVKSASLRSFLGLIGSLAEAFPEIRIKYDTTAIIAAIARTEDIDPDTLLRDAEEAKKMQEQQDQMMAQAQMAQAQAQEAQNQINQARLQLDQDKLQVDTVNKAEDRKADLLKAKLQAEIALKQKALPQPPKTLPTPRPGTPRPQPKKGER